MRKSEILLAIIAAGSLLAGCVTTTTTTSAESEADEENAAALNYQLGAQYLRNGNYERARDRLLLSIDLDPRNAVTHYTLALVYENLDNLQTGIHDYFKFLKFGFGRATDIACLHVRRGRLERAQALELVKRLDGVFPWTYLGVPLEEIIGPLGLSVDEFTRICDKFTNRKLFLRDARGNLLKDARGNLTRVNDDNVDA